MGFRFTTLSLASASVIVTTVVAAVAAWIACDGIGQAPNRCRARTALRRDVRRQVHRPAPRPRPDPQRIAAPQPEREADLLVGRIHAAFGNA